LAICTPDKEEEAKAAGADYVGLDEYIEKIEKGWTDIDVIITMPSVMGKVGKLGKILGPEGLCQTPKVVQLLWMLEKLFRK
jgi:large subunit ribosomal protein L1